MLFSELLRRRVAGEEEGTPHQFGEKAACRAFAVSIGVDVPRLYATAPTFDGIDFAALPDRFVIKPDGLYGTKGVYLLTREGEGRYRDQLRGVTVTTDDLRSEYARLSETVQVPAHYKVLVEEWITGEEKTFGPIPPDYKVYIFYGRPKIILQVNRNREDGGVAWFDGNFRPLRVDKALKSIPDAYHPITPVLPRHWKAVLRLARQVSLAMEVPFVRIDAFAADRGAVLGEITLAPGGAGYSYPFTPRFDAALGRAWERAQARIARDRAARRSRAGRPGATAPSAGVRTRRP